MVANSEACGRRETEEERRMIWLFVCGKFMLVDNVGGVKRNLDDIKQGRGFEGLDRPEHGFGGCAKFVPGRRGGNECV